jgi:heme-degrading monooxygenase HmoA
MTFVRIWRTRIDVNRLDEYERFVDEQSLPMFNAQEGFRGVVYSRRGDRVAVLSFWRDQTAVDALDTSATYQRAVKSIEATGFLIGDSSLEAFEIHAGALDNTAALFEHETR